MIKNIYVIAMQEILITYTKRRTKMSNLQRLEKELDFLAELNAMIKIRLALCTEEIKDILKED